MTTLLYFATGAFAGILAGLLGVGGGLVIVPMLTFIFAGQGLVPETHLLHVALGTSMASIVFTSVSSVRAHHARAAVDWRVLRTLTPGILAGTLLGSVLAAHLSTGFLKVFFAGFEFWVGTQMLLGIRPAAARGLPGPAGMGAAGTVIGAVSSLVGIGGGTLSVPFMLWCGVPMRSAIGTSAAIGFPIAVAGTVGFAVNGWGAAGLPAPGLGFVFLPALLALVVASVLTAPLGARLAHSLPVATLRKGFAVLLYLLGARMAYSLVG